MKMNNEINNEYTEQSGNEVLASTHNNVDDQTTTFDATATTVMNEVDSTKCFDILVKVYDKHRDVNRYVHGLEPLFTPEHYKTGIIRTTMNNLTFSDMVLGEADLRKEIATDLIETLENVEETPRYEDVYVKAVDTLHHYEDIIGNDEFERLIIESVKEEDRLAEDSDDFSSETSENKDIIVKMITFANDVVSEVDSEAYTQDQLLEQLIRENADRGDYLGYDGNKDMLYDFLDEHEHEHIYLDDEDEHNCAKCAVCISLCGKYNQVFPLRTCAACENARKFRFSMEYMTGKDYVVQQFFGNFLHRADVMKLGIDDLLLDRTMVPEFDAKSWIPGRFSKLSLLDLEYAFRSGGTEGSSIARRSLLDAIVVELVFRDVPLMEFKRLLLKYKTARNKKLIFKRSYERLMTKQKTRMDKLNLVKYPSSSVTHMTMDKQVLLSDWIFPRGNNYLNFGLFSIDSKAELLPMRWVIFGRNQAIFREMIESDRDLVFYQSWLDQKRLNDRNFGNRLKKWLEPHQADSRNEWISYEETNDVHYESGDVETLLEEKHVQWLNSIEQQTMSNVNRTFDDLINLGKNVGFFTDQVAALVVTIDLVIKQPTMISKLEVLYLYLRSFNLSSLITYIQNFVKENYREIEDKDWMFENKSHVNLMSHVLAFLGIANIMTLFTGNFPTPLEFFHKRFISLSHRMDGDDVIMKFFKTLRLFLETLVECCKVQSFAPFYSVGTSPSEVLFEAECLEMFRNQIIGITDKQVNDSFLKLREEGRIPNYWTMPFTPSAYISRCYELRDIMDTISTMLSIPQAASMKAARQKINVLISSCENGFEVNSLRPQPLGVAIIGHAGMGKSFFTKRIIEFIGDSKGFATDAHGRYDVQTNTNFQDNATPFNWAYVGDDLDAVFKEPTGGSFSWVEWVMQIVNTKPFPIESARLEDKGKNFGRPLLYLHCTNHKDLNLTRQIQHYEAVYRRLNIKLIVKAKDEFFKNGIVDTNGLNLMNTHEVQILRYDGVDYRHVMDTDDEGCLEYLLEMFDQNLNKQRGILSGKDVNQCKACCMKIDPDLVYCRKHKSLGEMVKTNLEGGTISTTSSSTIFNRVDNITAKAEKIVDRIESSSVVDNFINVVDGAKRVVDAPQNAYVNFSDFFWNHKVKIGIFLGGVISAIGAAILIRQTTYESRKNNSTDLPLVEWKKMATDKEADSKYTQTYTEEDAIRITQSAIKTFYNERKERVHCLHIGKGIFLVPFHCANNSLINQIGDDSGLLTKCYCLNVRRIGLTDVALAECPGWASSPSARPFIQPSPQEGTRVYDDFYLVTPDSLRYPVDRQLVDDHATFDTNFVEVEKLNPAGLISVGRAHFNQFSTNLGDCGLPLFAKTGNYIRIVGFHHAKREKPVLTWLAVGAWTTTSALFDMTMVLKTIPYLAPTVKYESGLDKEFEILPFCSPGNISDLKGIRSSELALALFKGAKVTALGHNDDARGQSSSKSKCKRTMMYDDLQVLREIYLQPKDYYVVPELKGAMIDGEWCSGFQNIFKHYRETNPNRDIMAKSIEDYVSNFKVVDNSGYTVLSDEEMFTGVLHSVIGPVNRATSVGPPFTGNKKQWITQDYLVELTLRKHIKEIEESLTNLKIPIVMASCTVKDEPIKFSKNLKRDFRIFNVLPASFNLVCKKYLGPIKAFLRNNIAISESMVGIDMSNDGGDYIAQLFCRNTEGQIDNVFEGDFTKMDKTINRAMAEAVVTVFSDLAKILSLDYRKVELLVRANFNCIYSIKGDMFHVGGMNPSGGDITVEINGIVNSLTHRYAHYSMSDRKFSLENTLVTYGDDFLLQSVKPHDILAQGFLKAREECGMIITDAYDKEKSPIPRRLEDCTFLKRTFYFNEVSNDYRCGLGVGSILRMVSIHKPSILSDKEHCAITLEESLREVFLSNYLDFELFRNVYRGIAEKYKLFSVEYLKLYTKEEYELMYMSRTFKSWGLAEEVGKPLEIDDINVIFENE